MRRVLCAHQIQFNTLVEFNTDQSMDIDCLSLMFNHQFDVALRFNDNIVFAYDVYSSNFHFNPSLIFMLFFSDNKKGCQKNYHET